MDLSILTITSIQSKQWYVLIGNIDRRVITVISARLLYYLQAREWYVVNNKALLQNTIVLIYKHTLYCIITARIYKRKMHIRLALHVSQ